MSTGVFEIDRDIICPCDYRDPDVQEYGSCYCCLYVDDTTFETGNINPIPERRPQEKQFRSLTPTQQQSVDVLLESPVSKTERVLHFCRVCGYVVFREEPPYVCPICKAKREMFAEIVLASR
jgi:ferredoxin-thioredoxin reductase catalytic chain